MENSVVTIKTTIGKILADVVYESEGQCIDCGAYRSRKYAVLRGTIEGEIIPPRNETITLKDGVATILWRACKH
jgi:hypothetical protein